MTFFKKISSTAVIYLSEVEIAAAADLSGKLSETTNLVSAIAKVFVALAIVVALMLLLIYFVKKLGLTNGLAKRGSHIKIIETRMIAPKKYIAIAQIAGKQLALGITDHHITLLTDLDDQIFSTDTKSPDKSPQVPSDDQSFTFAGVLQKSLSYLKNTPASKRESIK